MGFVSSFSLCTRNIICFSVDRPSPFQPCKYPHYKPTAELDILKIMLPIMLCYLSIIHFNLFTVSTLLLCDIPYYPSLRSSKKRWWSMSIQVRNSTHICYLWGHWIMKKLYLWNLYVKHFLGNKTLLLYSSPWNIIKSSGFICIFTITNRIALLVFLAKMSFDFHLEWFIYKYYDSFLPCPWSNQSSCSNICWKVS